MLIEEVEKEQRDGTGTVLALTISIALLALYLISPVFREEPQWRAGGFAIVFAGIAFILKGVNLSGAFSGMVVAFIFFGLGGWPYFGLLLCVFAVTLVATKIHSRKLGVAHLPRNAKQVLANLFVPTALLTYAAWEPYFAIIAAPLTLATLAELATDTVASEIGQSYGRATYSPLGFRPVNKGANGGLSFVGTIAGLLAAAVISLTAMLVLPNTNYAKAWWLYCICGLAGMVVDSLLGATLEDAGLINNEGVNFLGTTSAAALAYVLFVTVPIRI